MSNVITTEWLIRKLFKLDAVNVIAIICLKLIQPITALVEIFLYDYIWILQDDMLDHPAFGYSIRMP